MNLLYLAYLGNVQYYSKLCCSECSIDIYENYVKQSYRNRCEIMTAGGRTALTVNVVKPGNFSRTPLRDVRIDNSKRWQHIHWQAIVSSYANSPYFDYYAHLFEPFYRKEYVYLYDLNRGLMETVIGILGSTRRPVFSDRYIDLRMETGDAGKYTDYRSAISPKARLKREDTRFVPEPYWQVFSDRFPFEENLSVIDLLFCEGPAAGDIIRRSYRDVP
ncbi:MAG: WbqC family protein [Rikenellaceae bacterium]|nr:WbqC family protein [Rikenellaceae bacterium]